MNRHEDMTTLPRGLTAEEAARQLATDGPNALPGGQGRSWQTIVRETMREPMFLLLLAAGALYLAFGDLQEGLVLFGFVVVTLGLTLYQEGKTERAIEALRDLTSPRALVLRDGQQQRIAGRDVVRGDIVILGEGDRIPADGVLLSANVMQVDESLLTGEAVAVDKLAAAGAVTPSRPGGDNQPHVYAGSLVVRGKGMARVTATGPCSEIGRIGVALESLQVERSPLQKQTAQLVRTLAGMAFALSLLLVVAHGFMHGDWLQALLAGIALAMAMLPEEYPVVLTVFPALGARRLSREKVLTRRLTAIETLGATSVLCVDKTGTLTENRMTVARLQSGEALVTVDYAAQPAELPEAVHTLVEFAILASAVDPFDPMEQAFQRLGQHFLARTEHLHDDWVLMHEYALTPELRAMAHVWRATTGDAHVVAAKGAPEAIIDLCHLDETRGRKIADDVNVMAAQGLRVLAVAQAQFAGEDWPPSEHDFEFEFVGLLGLYDPLRPEIPEAVRESRAAGIRVLMITGDYPATARTIAEQAGLAAGEVLSGDEMAGMTDAGLRAHIGKVSVCARISPDQKLRIVQALKANGDVVAMTGDGVNDAPALKAAHVGIAMGGRGTDVAREASSLVLLDDNFASIVRAMKLGRRIFDNLRKSMSYILAVHVPIAGMALLPALFGLPAMLFPMHIAFLELIIDPACSVAFENEPAEADVMRRPPRNPDEPLFGGKTLLRALLQGAGVLVVVMTAYVLAQRQLPEDEARAFAFVTLVVANLALIVSNRSRENSFLAAWRTSNPVLWGIVGMTLTILTLCLYVPALNALLRFAPLPLPELALGVALGMASVFWFELVRMVVPAKAARQS